MKTISQGATLKVFFTGSISHDTDYSKIDLNGVRVLTINFDSLELINSSGILVWSEFLDNIPKHINIQFEDCPIRFVEQMGLIPDLTGNREVEILSVKAPFYCEGCDKPVELKLLQYTLSQYKETGKLRTKQCLSCEGDLEFDGIESKFFAFLRWMT